MIHLDTSFVVVLLRERRRDWFGAASEWLEALPDDTVLAVSIHVVCALMAGAHAVGAPLVTRNPRPFSKVPGLQVTEY